MFALKVKCVCSGFCLAQLMSDIVLFYLKIKHRITIK